jgi:hypothetical protein
MKRGFIGLIVFILFLAAIVGIGFFIYQNYSSTPSETTRKVARSIYKYPNATTWQEEDSKNVCFLDPKGCAQPVKIFFETPDSWGILYGYYLSAMSQAGWKSNSMVVTSIPTSVVFTRTQDNCQISMENHSDIKYSFTTVCPDH